jgi:ABC-type antimicrobial peptide transport system permease subunit
VAQRVPEIGVRIALGANRRDVMTLIVRGALYPVCVGGAIGLIALAPLSRVLKSYLFQVSPADPLSLAAAAAILIVAAVAAAYVPARRATRVDPLLALRAQ